MTYLNVGGLTSPYKRSMLWKEALSQKCDIYCAQETHHTLFNPPPPPVLHQDFFTTSLQILIRKTKGVMIAIKDTVTFFFYRNL